MVIKSILIVEEKKVRGRARYGGKGLRDEHSPNPRIVARKLEVGGLGVTRSSIGVQGELHQARVRAAERREPGYGSKEPVDIHLCGIDRIPGILVVSEVDGNILDIDGANPFAP